MRRFTSDRGKTWIEGTSLIVALLFVSALLLGATTSWAQVNKVQIIPLDTFATGTYAGAGAGFDIGWVDGGVYYLAERTVLSPPAGRVEIINAIEDESEGYIGGFVGTNPAAIGPADGRGSRLSGPNGIVVVPAAPPKTGKKELWAGDGDSTVKVVDLSVSPPSIVAMIPTGGSHRADELAFDPIHRIIMVANDLEPVDGSGKQILTPPGSPNADFVTFIDQKTRTVKGHIYYDGSCTSKTTPCPPGQGPNANPAGVGPGLEQSVWDSGFFYFSVPATDDYPGGEIDKIDPVKMQIVARYDAKGCGPTGLSLGPAHNLIMGCGGPIAIMNDVTGGIVATFPTLDGADEVWYNPGDGHYYLALNACDTAYCQGINPNKAGPGYPVLAVINAFDYTITGAAPTGGSAHSVAVNPLNNHAYVPTAGDHGIAVFELADTDKGFDLDKICKERGLGKDQGYKEQGRGEEDSYNEWGRGHR